jgi:hypothetical protein
VATATTAADGTYSAAVAVDPAAYRVTAQFAGSSTLWPATGTVPGAPAPGTAPSVVSLTPSAPSGSSSTFSVVFSDPAGWNAIANAEVLINSTALAQGGCEISYLPASGTFQLLNDAGTVWSSAVLSNGQCTLSGASASGSGNTLTLTFTVTLTPGFGSSGSQKSVFLQASDLQGAILSWTSSGTWSGVPSCAQTGGATASDVATLMSQALGGMAAGTDLNGDSSVNIVDVQIAVSDVLGCRALTVISPSEFGMRRVGHHISWIGKL